VTISTLDAAAKGALTHSGRTALIGRAKAVAVPVVSCVAASLRPDHLLADFGRDEMAALVIVLAESADLTRLRAVVAARDDGVPVTGLAEVRLRHAHAEVWRLTNLCGVKYADLPAGLKRLERDYQRMAKQKQREGRSVAAA
jgi:hypothetical protein